MMKLTITLLIVVLVAPVIFNSFTGCREVGHLSVPPYSSIQDCTSVVRYAPTKDTDKPVNSWFGLVPLKSTILDVENALGKAKWSHGSTFVYETACERVDVVYSKGACELSEVYRYDVPANVVIRLEIAPKQKITVDDLKLNQTYVREQESHPANWIQYRSREVGIRISALTNNNVETITVLTYEPRAKDRDRECSPTK
jgi:hypothetical protein